MSILIIGYLEVATTETEIMRNHRMSTKALYIAEGGVQAGIRYIIDNLLGDSDWSDNGAVIYTNVTPTGWDGDYDVELKNGTQDTIDVESTGEVSGFTRTIIQTVTREAGAPEAFYYAMHSFGSTTMLMFSDGTINGDVASTGWVLGEAGMTINGTVTDGSSVPEPSVSMAGYKSIADNIKSNGFTFTSGNTYGAPGSEEIWYIKGNAYIQENVTIYGSVIAQNNITFTGWGNIDDITIDAASGYPAIISGNNISGDWLRDSTISGLIYADNNISLNWSNNLVINGTILSGNTTTMRFCDDLTVNYDSDIIENPPPYFSGGETGGGVRVSAWQET